VSFTNNGIELRGWIVNPKQDKALLYYGGNAEGIEQNISFFQNILPNYSVYLIPYRGYGDSMGEPTENGLYSDALHIYDQLVTQHTKISLLGRSLGSGIATYVAARRNIEKLILVTPYDSIENVAKGVYWMLPVSLLLKDKYNSLGQVAQIKTLPLILMAEYDQVIPRKHSENLISAFGKKQQSVIIKEAGHNDISAHPEYANAIYQYLQSKEH
jgi:pimeloyl-ACP methyl ester carboxylesterase